MPERGDVTEEQLAGFLESLVSGEKFRKFPERVQRCIQFAQAIQHCRDELDVDSESIYTGFEILFPEKMSMDDRIKKEAELGSAIEEGIKKARGLDGQLPSVINRILVGNEVNATEMEAGIEYLYDAFSIIIARIDGISGGSEKGHAHPTQLKHLLEIQLPQASDKLSLTSKERRGLDMLKKLARFADPAMIGTCALLRGNGALGGRGVGGRSPLSK